MYNRAAFTIIELVFVIVVLGILASIAVPKFAATRDDAYISKAIATVASVRSGIITERQQRLFRGDNQYINQIDHGSDVIFDHNGTAENSILAYGIQTKNANGHWRKTGDDTYAIKLMGTDVIFTYNSNTGAFDCNRTNATYGDLCKTLVD